MPEAGRAFDRERARAIALAKVAARYGIACGGLDAASTLEALRARIEAALAEGDAALAEALTREIAAETSEA